MLVYISICLSTIQYVLLMEVLCLLSVLLNFLNIAKTAIYCHVLRARFLKWLHT